MKLAALRTCAVERGLLYTRIGSDRGNSHSTIMHCIQNIRTHSNGTTAPSLSNVYGVTRIVASDSGTEDSNFQLAPGVGVLLGTHSQLCRAYNSITFMQPPWVGGLEVGRPLALSMAPLEVRAFWRPLVAVIQGARWHKATKETQKGRSCTAALHVTLAQSIRE